MEKARQGCRKTRENN